MKRLPPKYCRLLLLLLLILCRAGGVRAEPPAPEGLADSVPLAAEKWRFKVDQDNSVINFLLKGNVHDTHGSVTNIKGEVSAFFTVNGALSQPEVSITLRSNDLDTGHNRRDRRMKQKFLEVQKFPEIVFRTAGLKIELEQTKPFASATAQLPFSFDMAGKLSLHGKTKNISLQISAFLRDDRLITEGHTILNLKDFAIKNPSLLFMRVENEVRIDFHIEALRISRPDAVTTGKPYKKNRLFRKI